MDTLALRFTDRVIWLLLARNKEAAASCGLAERLQRCMCLCVGGGLRDGTAVLWVELLYMSGRNHPTRENKNDGVAD